MTAPAYPPLPGGGTPHPNPPLAVHLFAGPGGNEEGLRAAGWTGRQVGFEWDEAACLTAMANGHQRVRADVSQVSLRHLRGSVELVAAAPPCQPYSRAGDQLGLLDLEAVLERVDAFATGHTPRHVHWHDPRSPLAAEPMRHIADIRPQAVMLEQVPAVLPLWKHIAAHLDRLGYSTWTGLMNAVEYGDPQTRRRAILMASLDVRVNRPMPTHQNYAKGTTPASDLFVRPWVSIREALGQALGDAVIGQARNSGPGAEREPRDLDAPSYTIRANGSGNAPAGVEWVMQYERQANGGRRTVDEPSLTIMAGHDNGNLRFSDVTGLTTRAVTVAEAALLQSFPPGFRFLGSKSKQHEQVGNATPVRLSAAVFRPLLAHLSAAAAA